MLPRRYWKLPKLLLRSQKPVRTYWKQSLPRSYEAKLVERPVLKVKLPPGLSIGQWPLEALAVIQNSNTNV